MTHSLKQPRGTMRLVSTSIHTSFSLISIQLELPFTALPCTGGLLGNNVSKTLCAVMCEYVSATASVDIMEKYLCPMGCAVDVSDLCLFLTHEHKNRLIILAKTLKRTPEGFVLKKKERLHFLIVVVW